MWTESGLAAIPRVPPLRRTRRMRVEAAPTPLRAEGLDDSTALRRNKRPAGLAKEVLMGLAWRGTHHKGPSAAKPQLNLGLFPAKTLRRKGFKKKNPF